MNRDTEIESERDTAPERPAERYDLRVTGRQQVSTERLRTRARGQRRVARRPERGRVGLGGGPERLRRPAPTFVMPFPMIPGAGVRAHPQLAARRALGSPLR